MHLSALQLFNFRNLGEQHLSFAPDLNVIVGNNGQGKTNLIEAISLLSLGRSFRTSRQQELIHWGEMSASVYGTVVSQAGTKELGIILEGRTRKAFVDGKKVAAINDFFGNLICISFSPGDLSLVKGFPQERRKFLDRHVADLFPPVLEHYLAYYRALKHKNELLRCEAPEPEALRSWNMVLAQSAWQILNARARFLQGLEPLAAALHRRFGGQDGELTIALQGTLAHEGKMPGGAQEVFEILEHFSAREIAKQGSLAGVHRDDLEILLNGKSARAFSSQGQTRSVVLSLKLAVIELLRQVRGEEPVVLLDDVDSELDSKRSNAFFEMLSEHAHQVFITGTDVQHLARVWKNKGVSVLCIENGQLRSTPAA